MTSVGTLVPKGEEPIGLERLVGAALAATASRARAKAQFHIGDALKGGANMAISGSI